VTANLAPSTDSFSNEVILVTGAGGSIGSAIARQLSISAPSRTTNLTHVRAQHCCAPAWHDVIRTVVLLDHSEQNLYEINSELKSAAAATNTSHQIIPILGDVTDAALLHELFEKYRPKTIFHAAAFKHVPLMEENPIAVIRNNILGTWTLATVAAHHKARELVMVSTDKAADPSSIMGATKRVAELILSCLDSPETRLRSVRLCNVLRSTGSVVPLFERQIRTGGPVTLTHPDASRYFISLQEATRLIFLTAALADTGTLFIPELDTPVKILDLAKKMIAESSDSAPKQIKFIPGLRSGCPRTIGLRPGEKLEERLISSSETVEPTAEPKLRRINGSIPSAKTLSSAITLISEKLHSRDLPALLDTICSLVPNYHPSDTLNAIASAHASTTAKA
jgi:FlaA1/EpsC-like NDP-sugar epimerase